MKASQLGPFGSEFADAIVRLRIPLSKANLVPIHSGLRALQPAWNAAAISLSATQSPVTGLRRPLVSGWVSAHMTPGRGRGQMTKG